MRDKVIPRGFRNNNPLNIRIGNVWLGEVTNPDDPEFEQFVSMKYGIRAGFVLLRRYINHYKRNTIAAIISAWSPRTENNTLVYIDRVSQMAKIYPDEALKFEDKNKMCALVDAMIKVECGQRVDYKIISESYDMT